MYIYIYIKNKKEKKRKESCDMSKCVHNVFGNKASHISITFNNNCQQLCTKLTNFPHLETREHNHTRQGTVLSTNKTLLHHNHGVLKLETNLKF